MVIVVGIVVVVDEVEDAFLSRRGTLLTRILCTYECTEAVYDEELQRVDRQVNATLPTWYGLVSLVCVVRDSH